MVDHTLIPIPVFARTLLSEAGTVIDASSMIKVSFTRGDLLGPVYSDHCEAATCLKQPAPTSGTCL